MDIGGQAVIEGVMMRSPKYYAVAVRKPDKKIKVKTERFRSLGEKHRILKWPFFRGIISMFEMLKLGINALVYSGNETVEEEEKISSFGIFVTVLVSILFALALFLALPYFLTTIIGVSEDTNTVLFNIVDGLIKISILILYIYLIGLMKDVRTIFQYHGAEHKAVNCYEAGKPMTAKNAKKYTTAHPRCGTSFIMIVFFIMLVLFSFVPTAVKLIVPQIDSISFIARRLLLLGVRLLFVIPVIAISYEILKLSSRVKDNPLVRALIYPGIAIQKLTTREPNMKQLEVALRSLKAVLAAEKA